MFARQTRLAECHLHNSHTSLEKPTVVIKQMRDEAVNLPSFKDRKANWDKGAAEDFIGHTLGNLMAELFWVWQVSDLVIYHSK